MILSRIPRWTAGQARCALRCRAPRSVLRRFSTTRPASAAPNGDGNGSISALGGLMKDLDDMSPRFDIYAKDVSILQTPSQFYDVLKAKILNAKTRVFLSALYVGRSERELIATIQTALHKNRDLKVSFLVDALRGTRETPDPSCASLLASLVTEFGSERVDIRMYHTPNLTGLRKRIMPKRINEGWGLQHMKLYAFDDEIILSGANLSQDYFTNRQDRYFLFRSALITDYFSKLHEAVSKLSYQVKPSSTETGSYTLEWPASNESVSPLENPEEYIATATKRIQPLLVPQKSQSQPLSKTDTALYPLSQFTPLLTTDTSTELPGLQKLLATFLTSPSPSTWTFTAGYFNVHPSLSALLTRTTSPGTVITASAQANGFYGSAGVSGLLPAAYILLSRRFLEAAGRSGALNHIKLREWRRGTVGETNGWTYHAKGIWISLPGESDPSITLIGSSNYTQRSYKLDLETNALIVTRNEELKKKLKAETDHLLENTSEVVLEDFQRNDRRVGIKVRFAMFAVKILGGAL